MILTRLYELAQREHLLDDIAFELMPIPFVVQLGKDGEYLGLQDRRETITIPSKKKDAPPRTRQGKGRELPVPRPHGNTASQGFARFFADTLPRVLPVTDEEKSARSRSTFWEQVGRAAEETNDPALRAVQAFGRRLTENADLPRSIRSDVERLEAETTDRCTFAWDPDGGRTILEREPVRSWYAAFFQATTSSRQEAGPRGVCQITGQVGPLPTTHPIRLSGVPGGLPTGVSIVSYDKAAFESYGLEGTANAGLGYEATDGYLRALSALIAGRIKGNPLTSYRIGSVLCLFWTREFADTGFMALFDTPDPAQVEHLLASAGAGQESQAIANANDFYLLALSGNSARAIIRDYLEAPLPCVQENLAKWFRDLRIADLSREGAGKPTSRFPLWQLCSATALNMEQVSPDTPARLLEAALHRDPLPDSILAACLARLRAEGGDGFRPPRLALIKLTLLRRNQNVSESLNADETHPTYVCGRLLAIFEDIQRAALRNVNTTVVDKFFGTFSVAPAMVLGRLFDGAQHHLRKLRGDNPGACVALEKRLGEVALLLKAPPSGRLTLEEQGRFALGYYHQRARQFETIAERKAARAEQNKSE
jgi:CRISPR-associated protein Csd1